MPETNSEILDLAFLHKQTANDASLERELLQLLVDQCAHFLPSLVSTDEAVRREAAHGLRGAAASLGAKRLAASAMAIEAGEQPDVAIERAVGEVTSVIERLLARDAA